MSLRRQDSPSSLLLLSRRGIEGKRQRTNEGDGIQDDDKVQRTSATPEAVIVDGELDGQPQENLHQK